MENKMTQRDYYNEIIALAIENDRDDLVEFCNGRIVQLDKKSASKSSRASKITDEKKEIVLSILAEIGSGTVGAIVEHSNGLFTNSQQATPIVTALLKADSVKAEVIKGRKVYSVA